VHVDVLKHKDEAPKEPKNESSGGTGDKNDFYPAMFERHVCSDCGNKGLQSMMTKISNWEGG